MRMLDAETQRSVRQLQLYLAPPEARELRDALEALLRDPEAAEHVHILDREGAWELSLSIVTDRKLRSSRYTTRERALLDER